ncbi:MAG: ABC transporter permease [Chloroflexota bacterium]
MKDLHVSAGDADDPVSAFGRARRREAGRLRSLLQTDRLLLASLLGTCFLCLVALFPTIFATQPPNTMNLTQILASPSSEFLIGTDEYGRDVWSRMIDGTSIAMLVAVSSMAIALAIGVPIGLVAGWRGGVIDSVVMRLQDALLAFPTLLFAILIVAVLGPSAWTIVETMALAYIPRFARLTRGGALLLKNAEFIVACRCTGASDVRIMFRHLLPNLLPTLLVQASLGLGFAILTEASLSYLGLGVQPPQATWGSMLRVAQRYAHEAPWYVLGPGAAIFVAVLLFNFLGDRLRDNLDPRLRNVTRF